MSRIILQRIRVHAHQHHCRAEHQGNHGVARRFTHHRLTHSVTHTLYVNHTTPARSLLHGGSLSTDRRVLYATLALAACTRNCQIGAPRFTGALRQTLRCIYGTTVRPIRLVQYYIESSHIICDKISWTYNSLL